MIYQVWSPARMSISFTATQHVLILRAAVQAAQQFTTRSGQGSSRPN
jgi:hypothetical protein